MVDEKQSRDIGDCDKLTCSMQTPQKSKFKTNMQTTKHAY
jgi:hypothetical protein